MFDLKSIVTAALTAVVVVVLAGLVGGNQSDLLGATGTRFPNGISADSTSPSAGQIRGTTLTITGSQTISSTGSAISGFNFGTCYLRPRAATIAASSTALVECQGTAAWNGSGVSAISGVGTSDTVLVQLSTTTAGATLNGLSVIGATPSSTAGFIMLDVSNKTGGVYTWPTTGTASGTANFISID